MPATDPRRFEEGYTGRMNDPLAEAAVDPIREGMVVGLGTGRAASRCIHALAARDITVRCVATSIRSAELAESLGLRVEPFSDVPAVDYLFDGADEIDPDLRMIKGAGGAMTREKMIAQVAAHRVYVIDESKLVARLGERMPLPIEFLAFGKASLLGRIAALGLEPSIRERDPAMTDEGNPIVDAWLGSADPVGVDEALGAMPGIVEHGLFLREADRVLIERADGSVESRDRAAS
jgi:ribose 5-phosphate isomerase A